jgi:anhydro-N-acetylmuramic acid kinase
MRNSFPVRVIGLMSGTSLDGLDICLVKFTEENGGWKYEIEKAETVRYSGEWINGLLAAEKKSGDELDQFSAAYGKYLGECVKDFISRNKISPPDFIASHGHTIFHQPEKGITFQAGDGAALREASGLPVVCDFRTLDVSLGGQGAPLVPVGDELLFGKYTYCLNLGGIANISTSVSGKRIAYDICAVNYVLNRLAKKAGKDFDEDGKLSAKGKIIPSLLEKLNALPYFHKSPPKSIGREWIEAEIFPLLNDAEKTEDLLRTFSEHIALQVAACCDEGTMLVTGGGAHNKFLISLLREKCKTEIIVPDKETVDFKEALIFAFLGLLRWENKINTLSSVTGASRDSSGGVIYR